MLVLILGTGLYLMLGLKFMPLVRLGVGFRLLWQGRSKDDESSGEISPFQALMTCLAATVGTGNIAGVATAIFLGGPGALFWMWCTALVGMATKFSEVVLAVHYREKDERNEHVGGPMYAIKNGLGKRWAWLGAAFALFGGLAGFGIGNMVQVNSMADALRFPSACPTGHRGRHHARHRAGDPWWHPPYRQGRRSPGALHVRRLHRRLGDRPGGPCRGDSRRVPTDLHPRLHADRRHRRLRRRSGDGGNPFRCRTRDLLQRGRPGTAGIAQAAGTTHSAVRSGLIGMLGTFIDTLIICSLTGLAIITSGVWTSGASGAALSSAAFEAAMPGVGHYILSLALVVFAYTTILGWSYYGERCWEYLAGTRAILPFRIVWTLAIPFGAMTQLDFAWLVADTLNALMAIPNLIALLLLSPVVFRLTREYFAKARS